MQKHDKDQGRRSSGWVSSLSTVDPELPAKCAKIQIHLPFIFKNYREQFAEMLLCHTLFLLIPEQRDIAVTSQNHEYKSCLVFSHVFFFFSWKVYFLFFLVIVFYQATWIFLISVQLLLKRQTKIIYGQLFFVGSLPSFLYSGSGRKYFTFSCSLTLKSTERWCYLNIGFSVKKIQLSFQIQNSHASLTGRNLYSSIFSLCSGLVRCLVMGQH